MGSPELSEEDRQMVAGFEALARRARRRKLLRWTLVLVPGVPLLIVSIFTIGMVMSVATLALIVGWALLLEKVLPDISVV